MMKMNNTTLISLVCIGLGYTWLAQHTPLEYYDRFTGQNTTVVKREEFARPTLVFDGDGQIWEADIVEENHIATDITQVYFVCGSVMSFTNADGFEFVMGVASETEIPPEEHKELILMLTCTGTINVNLYTASMVEFTGPNGTNFVMGVVKED